jgi:hypothetical protein
MRIENENLALCGRNRRAMAWLESCKESSGVAFSTVAKNPSAFVSILVPFLHRR